MFASLGYELVVEDTTNHGRIDLTVKTKQAIWLFEFKVLDVPRQGKGICGKISGTGTAGV